MRMFKRYFPILIAKHISRLFNGNIYIQGRGGFKFDHGLLVAPVNSGQMQYQTVREINNEIKKLKN